MHLSERSLSNLSTYHNDLRGMPQSVNALGYDASRLKPVENLLGEHVCQVEFLPIHAQLGLCVPSEITQ